MEKENLFARGINSEVLEEFREIVKRKHGKLHTVFSQEVEIALKEYVKENKEIYRTHNTSQEVGDKFLDFCEEKGFEKQITHQKAGDLITLMTGLIDERTIKKYLRVLVLGGYLTEVVKGRVYNINYSEPKERIGTQEELDKKAQSLPDELPTVEHIPMVDMNHPKRTFWGIPKT